jgi:hypothetical protein
MEDRFEEHTRSSDHEQTAATRSFLRSSPGQGCNDRLLRGLCNTLCRAPGWSVEGYNMREALAISVY